MLLGSSGVGKTQLIKSLISENPSLIHYSNRTTATTKTKLGVDNVPFNIIDTVGQDSRKPDRISAIRDNMNSINLIINVVCYGYHEYATGKDYAFTVKGELKRRYLSDNRKLEIEQLKEWTEILCGHDVAYKLITIITKADLWWDKQKEVIEYYKEGDYYKSLGSCTQLHPTVLHYSSVHHMLYNKVPTSGYFDDTKKKEARKQLFQAFIEAVGKGGNNNE